MQSAGPYDDALLCFHRRGPEYDGYLSNHGPMVVEVLARRGHSDMIEPWTIRYARRLDEPPRGEYPVTDENWPAALGQVRRVTDWTDYLQQQLHDEPWRVVLARWWPRLLPGVAAGATHGVIRVGHVVQALSELESAPRVAELGHALGYWAARWQPIAVITPTGRKDAAAVLPSVPRVAIQQGGFRDRLAQLDSTAGWAQAVASVATLPTDTDAPAAVERVVDAVVGLYADYAPANPTMLVHAATAPNAIAMALPQLPFSVWRDSMNAAWTATAAVVAAYAAAVPHVAHATEPLSAQPSPDDAVDHALRAGGEHVIKFADTAVRSHQRTGNQAAVSAIMTAIHLDA